MTLLAERAATIASTSPAICRPDAWFYLVEPADVEEEGRRYLERLERPQDVHNVSTTMRQITRFASVTAAGVPAGSLETTCHLGIESVERFSGDIAKVRDELDASMGADGGGQEVFVVCQTEAESQAAARDLRHDPAGRGRPAALSDRPPARPASAWWPIASRWSAAASCSIGPT